MTTKSTVEEIRQRFDHDVERFSNLETGHQAMPGSPHMLELIAEAASVVSPNAKDVLDIGCGAGNYSLKLLERLPDLNFTLIDLSQPMLERAQQRVGSKTSGRVELLQGDIRQLDLGVNQYDIILAAAVLHHLRSDDEWEAVFERIYRSLRPGGSFWISDMVEHSHPAIQAMAWEQYGDYLVSLRDEAYRDHVFAYIEKEDTPRPLMYQLELLRRVGFKDVDILHKHSIGAAFGGIKAR